MATAGGLDLALVSAPALLLVLVLTGSRPGLLEIRMIHKKVHEQNPGEESDADEEA